MIAGFAAAQLPRHSLAYRLQISNSDKAGFATDDYGFAFGILSRANPVGREWPIPELRILYWNLPNTMPLLGTP